MASLDLFFNTTKLTIVVGFIFLMAFKLFTLYFKIM